MRRSLTEWPAFVIPKAGRAMLFFIERKFSRRMRQLVQDGRVERVCA